MRLAQRSGGTAAAEWAGTCIVTGAAAVPPSGGSSSTVAATSASPSFTKTAPGVDEPPEVAGRTSHESDAVTAPAVAPKSSPGPSARRAPTAGASSNVNSWIAVGPGSTGIAYGARGGRTMLLFRQPACGTRLLLAQHRRSEPDRPLRGGQQEELGLTRSLHQWERRAPVAGSVQPSVLRTLVRSLDPQRCGGDAAHRYLERDGDHRLPLGSSS